MNNETQKMIEESYASKIADIVNSMDISELEKGRLLFEIKSLSDVECMTYKEIYYSLLIFRHGPLFIDDNGYNPDKDSFMRNDELRQEFNKICEFTQPICNRYISPEEFKLIATDVTYTDDCLGIGGV